MPHDLNWDGCRNVRDLGGFVSSVGTTRVRVVVRAVVRGTTRASSRRRAGHCSPAWAGLNAAEQHRLLYSDALLDIRARLV